jgi:hypothetical protein
MEYNIPRAASPTLADERDDRLCSGKDDSRRKYCPGRLSLSVGLLEGTCELLCPPPSITESCEYPLVCLNGFSSTGLRL